MTYMMEEDYLKEKVQRLKRSNAALRGQITKLKKRMSTMIEVKGCWWDHKVEIRGFNDYEKVACPWNDSEYWNETYCRHSFPSRQEKVESNTRPEWCHMIRRDGK